MPKQIKYVVLNARIPEWGVAPSLSTAVPIVVSGAQVKSTKDVSNGMYSVLRHKVSPNLVDEVRKLIAKTKREKDKNTYFSGTFSKGTGRAAYRTGALTRKSR